MEMFDRIGYTIRYHKFQAASSVFYFIIGPPHPHNISKRYQKAIWFFKSNDPEIVNQDTVEQAPLVWKIFVLLTYLTGHHGTCPKWFTY